MSGITPFISKIILKLCKIGLNDAFLRQNFTKNKLNRVLIFMPLIDIVQRYVKRAKFQWNVSREGIDLLPKTQNYSKKCHIA